MQEEYNALMEAYVSLPVETQREEIINKIRELIYITNKLAVDVGANGEFLFNREILDLNNENVSEKDFLEGTYAYLNALEDMLGKYIEKIADIEYE